MVGLGRVLGTFLIIFPADGKRDGGRIVKNHIDGQVEQIDRVVVDGFFDIHRMPVDPVHGPVNLPGFIAFQGDEFFRAIGPGRPILTRNYTTDLSIPGYGRPEEIVEKSITVMVHEDDRDHASNAIVQGNKVVVAAEV